MWTLFWDMHSGGGLKEDYAQIYIEAPLEEAKVIFYNRFGHSPDRVSCTCCGEDYSVDESETLEQASGYHRNCKSAYKKRDHLYLEKNGSDWVIPEGYELTTHKPYGKYMTIEEFEKSKDVLIIRADEIDDSERVGTVPSQGYVWID